MSGSRQDEIEELKNQLAELKQLLNEIKEEQPVENKGEERPVENIGEDFAANVWNYMRGRVAIISDSEPFDSKFLLEHEARVLNFGPYKVMVDFIKSLTSQQIESFEKQKETPDFTKMNEVEIKNKLIEIGLEGLGNILSQDRLNDFIASFKQVRILELQEFLSSQKSEATEPNADASMITSFMNNWPCLIPPVIRNNWLADFKKLVDGCKLYSENGEAFIADPLSGELNLGNPTIDASSKKKLRQFLEKIMEQALKDFCDESGEIKLIILEALGLTKAGEKISKDLLLEKLIAGYLTNQVAGILAEEASADKKRMHSQDVMIKGEAKLRIKKNDELLNYFLEILRVGLTDEDRKKLKDTAKERKDEAELNDPLCLASIEEDRHYNEFITPRVVIHTSLANLEHAIKKRQKNAGSKDPLYLASKEAYNNFCAVAKGLLSEPKVDKNKLDTFKFLAYYTAAEVRKPLNLEAKEKLLDILSNNSLIRESSIWAKLGAGILVVVGVAAMSCGIAGTIMSGGVDMGSSAYLGYAIAGFCFTAAGALWGGYQYRQGALKRSIFKTIHAAEKTKEVKDYNTAPRPKGKPPHQR